MEPKVTKNYFNNIQYSAITRMLDSVKRFTLMNYTVHYSKQFK